MRRAQTIVIIAIVINFTSCYYMRRTTDAENFHESKKIFAIGMDVMRDSYPNKCDSDIITSQSLTLSGATDIVNNPASSKSHDNVIISIGSAIITAVASVIKLFL